MLFDTLLLLYILAVGFVAAGLTASVYQLVTSRPARFELSGTSLRQILASGAFFALSGPMIVFQLAMAASRGNGPALPARVAAGVAVCALWSCCTGLILLDIGLSVARLAG